MIQEEEFKSERPHVLILNDVTRSAVEACQRQHADYVFAYRRKLKDAAPPNRNDDNTAWQKTRKHADLAEVRVHDLRHTFAQRLRDAGVTAEERAMLLGHAVVTMTAHDAAPTIERLTEMTNKAQHTRDTATVLRVANER